MVSIAPTIKPLRVRIFVDFWNFSFSIRREDEKFMVDWRLLGNLLTKEASALVDVNTPATFEALHVYGSYDKSKPNDQKLKNWFVNTLDKMPGVHVVTLERQNKKGFPQCPACFKEVEKCECGSDMRGTEEKGIDTRMVTDMISLAWANAYDVAVLLSADRDFVPVAEFLQS